MPYVFGVDGGASQCRAILMTTHGRVVYLGKGPGVNYHETGASQMSSTIKRLYHEALKSAHAREDECRAVCLGLAGSGRPQDHAILRPLFDTLFGKDAYLLMSDAEIALTSGTFSEYGIIIIAGTGSMIFGRNQEGRDGRIGGYGPLLSDEGSGYRIAQEGLRAAIKAYDETAIPTRMKDAFLKYLEFQTVSELIDWVNSEAATRKKIAALAPLVIKAADENDPSADDILNWQADALALGVETLKKRLELPGRFDVVLSGGLLKHAVSFSQLIKRKILYLTPGARVASPKMEPVAGAALYALSFANVSIDDDLMDSIKRSYQEHAQAAKVEPPSNTPDPQTQESPASHLTE